MPYSCGRFFTLVPAPLMPDLADYMTTQEAAAKMGYHLESVRRMLRDQELRGIKWGREWLVLRKSVEEYLKRAEGLGKFDPRRGN
ncbi:MAG: helix-turn-helix domain-containing protein [Anaerolineales bacterium]|nr:helix-turn-helix domain-containing protein [Anaerolineales bacterium]